MKRGLLEPKHRKALGIRLWLYLYILDITDWETGKVLEWRDKAVADELQMPLDTVREQRAQLEDMKYIKCKQRFQCLEITVNNWTNPREYSGEVYNEEAMVGENADHVEKNLNHGRNDGSNHGLNHGRNDGTRKLKTISSINIPHTTSTQNRKYTSPKSWSERKSEEDNQKAEDYSRFLRDPYYRQVSND